MRVETDPGTDPCQDAGGLTKPAATVLGLVDDPRTSFHVALDTIEARRLRADPQLVSIPGFLLLDTGDYEPVLALVSLDLFWRMQGMDMLARTRAVSRERRTRPRVLPMSGSVWLVEGKLDASEPAPGEQATEPKPGGPTARQAHGPSSCLRVCAVRALDRVSIERRGPRHIETIDIHTMLPRFSEKA